jgi:hypothetical protein
MRRARPYHEQLGIGLGRFVGQQDSSLGCKVRHYRKHTGYQQSIQWPPNRDGSLPARLTAKIRFLALAQIDTQLITVSNLLLVKAEKERELQVTMRTQREKMGG